MKKFLALLLSVAMMLIPMSAFAANDAIIDIDYNANEITISGNFDKEFAGVTATLVIVNPGKDIADFAEDGTIAWADQTVINNKGIAEFVVDMSSAETGVEYKAYIAVNGTDDVFTGMFNYTSAAEVLAMFEELAEIDSAEAMKTFLSKDTVKNASQLADKINAIADNDRVYAGIVEAGATDFASLEVALDDAVTAYEMSQDKEKFNKTFKEWIEDDADTYAIYKKLSDKDAVLAAVKDADPNSKVGFMVAYRDAVLTETINSAKNNTSVNTFIVKTAKDDIPEDVLDKYQDLKDKKPVQTALYGKKPFDDMADFIEELEDACDDQADAEEKKDNKKTSSGGSSSTKITVDPQIIATPAPVVTNPFADIPDNFWAKDAVLELYKKDIVKGQSANTFNPNATITRAEFVQMVVKAFGFGMKGDAPKFDDVANEWFANAVAVAYTNGVVKGTTDKTFAPTNNITRQDMMVILTNAAKAVGKTLSNTDKTFTDGAEIAAYASDAVSAMVGSGVVSGYTDGSVKPLANATRAEAAAMLNGLLGVK